MLYRNISAVFHLFIDSRKWPMVSNDYFLTHACSLGPTPHSVCTGSAAPASEHLHSLPMVAVACILARPLRQAGSSMPLTFPLNLALQSLRALGKYFSFPCFRWKNRSRGTYLKPWWKMRSSKVFQALAPDGAATQKGGTARPHLGHQPLPGQNHSLLPDSWRRVRGGAPACLPTYPRRAGHRQEVGKPSFQNGDSG